MCKGCGNLKNNFKNISQKGFSSLRFNCLRLSQLEVFLTCFFYTMGILKLLASSNLITVNKTLARKLSLEAAILYGDLASSQIYFGEGEWFFRTRETIEQETTLSKFQQIKAMKLLLEHGLIKEKLFGLPAKKHYIIDEECMDNFNNLSIHSSSII